MKKILDLCDLLFQRFHSRKQHTRRARYITKKPIGKMISLLTDLLRVSSNDKDTIATKSYSIDSSTNDSHSNSSTNRFVCEPVDFLDLQRLKAEFFDETFEDETDDSFDSADRDVNKFIGKEILINKNLGQENNGSFRKRSFQGGKKKKPQVTLRRIHSSVSTDVYSSSNSSSRNSASRSGRSFRIRTGLK